VESCSAIPPQTNYLTRTRYHLCTKISGAHNFRLTETKGGRGTEAEQIAWQCSLYGSQYQTGQQQRL